VFVLVDGSTAVRKEPDEQEGPMSISNGIVRMGLLAGAAALVSLAGCGLLGVDGNGERVNEVRALEGFSAVESDGSLDVEITRGDVFHVEVSIDSNLLPRVHTDVAGGALRIDEDSIGDTVPGPHVIVTMPVLRGATLSGSGGLRAVGFQQAEPVSLVLEGSGDISFAGDVSRVDVQLWGSGDARVSGIAPVLAVELDGSGAVDARGLDATTADLSLSGSGDIAASVSGSARVTLSGSGNVDVYGTATLDRVDISGSGSVRQH
jgi:hypothetical protein